MKERAIEVRTTARPAPLASHAGRRTATASPQYFRYQRAVTVSAGTGQSCAVIDPQIFPHSAPSLKDLRLYQDGREVPYAITLSEPQQLDSDSARVLNLGLRHRDIVFDLEMPKPALTRRSRSTSPPRLPRHRDRLRHTRPQLLQPTSLGEFTLFDLTSQHLSRNTTIHLQETSLPYLHIELAISPATGNKTLKRHAGDGRRRYRST